MAQFRSVNSTHKEKALVGASETSTHYLEEEDKIVDQDEASLIYPDRDRLIEKETISDDPFSSREKESQSTFQHIFKTKKKINYSTTLQKWKGIVTEITESGFKAELEDQTNPGTKEVASFDLEEISPDDQKLIEIGAVFYWSIGYKNQNGQVTKESLIRFQRIADWKEKDYDAAADRASSIYESLNFE